MNELDPVCPLCRALWPIERRGAERVDGGSVQRVGGLNPSDLPGSDSAALKGLTSCSATLQE